MRIFSGNVWRATCALLLAALLLGTGCARQSDDNALRDKLLQGVVGGFKQTHSATPSEGEDTDLAASPWAQKLEGWWVEVSRFTDPAHPMIVKFTKDGRVSVYDDPEAYERMLGDEDVGRDAWTVKDGEPHYVKRGGAASGYGRIGLDADGVMRVEWDGAAAWQLERNTGPRATTILMGGDYFFLADGAKLAFVLPGEALSEDGRHATVWLNDAVWVDFEDVELIARYGLEDVFADGNAEYFIYSDDSAWRPLFVMPDGGTVLRIIDGDADEVRWKTADFETFLALAEERSNREDDEPLLVYYSDEGTNSLVYAIREVYLA